MNKLFIIIPTYNEEANIRNIINEWYPIVEKISSESKLVFINGKSTDKTLQIIQDLSKKYLQLQVLDKPELKHGPALLFGYAYAIEQKADFIFQTDSDGQTNPEEFWPFWEDRVNYDFIIGSRNNRQDGFSRVFVTNILKLFIFLMLKTFVKDANTPFRLMNALKLKLYLDYIPNDFSLANVLITAIAVKRKEKIKWKNITFKPRQGGVNSIDLTKIFFIGLKAIKDFRVFIKNNKNLFIK
ncbi:MAG: glycosyltransferase family 2 protein [Candidatus Margulisiibacteriota bacterium]|jgi:glycosyltransferase involved in cell wall biosynthesis